MSLAINRGWHLDLDVLELSDLRNAPPKSSELGALFLKLARS